jgi:hypothetical protein
MHWEAQPLKGVVVSVVREAQLTKLKRDLQVLYTCMGIPL